jgi:uncharacterized protein YegP (UPF0339 family)
VAGGCAQLIAGRPKPRRVAQGSSLDRVRWFRDESEEDALAKFVIYADAGGHYQWKLVASNGQTTASSGESFASKANVREAAESVKASAATTDVVEE